MYFKPVGQGSRAEAGLLTNGKNIKNHSELATKGAPRHLTLQSQELSMRRRKCRHQKFAERTQAPPQPTQAPLGAGVSLHPIPMRSEYPLNQICSQPAISRKLAICLPKAANQDSINELIDSGLGTLSTGNPQIKSPPQCALAHRQLGIPSKFTGNSQLPVCQCTLGRTFDLWVPS